MSTNQPIQLGLCCLNTVLRTQNPPVFCSRKMIIRTIKQKGIIALNKKFYKMSRIYILFFHSYKFPLL